MRLRNILELIDTQFMPKNCVFCGVLSEGEEDNICTGCYADLPWTDVAVAPLPAPFECFVTPLNYEFPIDISIKALKFKRKLYYAPAFAEILRAACVLLPDDIDAVLPVPLHWRRKAHRGFNQAMEIAKPVARFLKVPIVRGICRGRATPFQSGLTARERERNLRQAFTTRRTFRHSHVLIVDDVVTTGATANSLAKVLKRNGVDRVSAMTVARSV